MRRERKAWFVEVFYRVMYIVFLVYLGLVISLFINSNFYLLLQICFLLGGFGGLSYPSVALGLGATLLLFLTKSLSIVWDRWFDLRRMDDNFCGGEYLDAHLDDPHWVSAEYDLSLLESSSLQAIDREVIRRRLCQLAHQSPSLYEAIYELGDERLRWTLVNCR